jgi:adenine C2-methylase RlmN of 23S rRNA A2503 and tRNA A37
MMDEQEEKGEEMQPLPERPTPRDVFTALSVLDGVISSSDADEKIVKALDEIQNFVSEIYKNSMKQRSIYSYFKKQYVAKL